MTHAEIAAQARKPYADAILKVTQERDQLLEAVRVAIADWGLGTFDESNIHELRAAITNIKGV